MTQPSLVLGPDAARAGVLLAWSGGLDSTVLLYLLRAWAAENGAALHALHIDHRLRASSSEDVAFCRHTAARWGVPLWVESLDINAAGSTQQNARIQRYATLARVANRLGLGVVATAHHADDAQETALLNLRRGTSSAGMSISTGAGGAPVPGWPDDIQLARPLSATFRAEIHAFARAHQIDWHEDPTNASAVYQRNRVRHDILPALSEDGRYTRGILRSLQNFGDENQALDSLANATLRAAWLSPPDAESVALRGAPFYSLPPALMGRALQLAARRLPAEVALTGEHRAAVADAIAARATRRVDIRAGVIHVTPRVILMEVARGRGAPHLRQRQAAPIPLSVSVALGQTARAVPWFGSTFRGPEPFDPDAPLSASPKMRARVYTFDNFDTPDGALTEPFILRGPRPGDRVKIAGLCGHKSVSDLLAEAQIPDFLRWRWPCLARDERTNRVEWVCGIRHGESGWAEAPPTSRKSIHWKIEPGTLFDLFLADDIF